MTGKNLAAGDGAVLPLLDEQELLGEEGAAHRDHHAPARLELGDERWRHVACGRRDHDDVEGRMLGPAVITVAGPHGHVVVAERVEPVGGARRERRHDLHRVDLGHELGQHRRLIARPGAELERHVVGLRLQQIGHQRDDIGLRDGLAVADGERPVQVAEVLQIGRHEEVTRHPPHRLHHPGVQLRLADPLGGLLSGLGNGTHHGRARLGDMDRHAAVAAPRPGEEQQRGDAERRNGQPSWKHDFTFTFIETRSWGTSFAVAPVPAGDPLAL